MAMQYTKEALIRFGDGDLAKIVGDVQGAFKKRHPDMPDIPLPPVTPEIRQPRGLEQLGFAIEIPTVSEELYVRTRESVEQAGYNFVVRIRPVSIEDLLIEDRQREQRRFGYVSDSKQMQATVPPGMEVAINPARFKIVDSNELPTDEQKKKIKQEQEALRRKMPVGIQQFVNMEMVDPSTLSQLEDAYMDETRELLLPDYFARTDIQTVRGRVAAVGRHGPADRRGVYRWRRNVGYYGNIFGVSVVVLPRKLTA